jgi:hypothetical protein
MEYGKATILDHLGSVEMDQSQPVIYDRPIGTRLLYEDPDSGAEHYLIRYPAASRQRCTGTPRPTRSSCWRASSRLTIK